MWEEEEEEEGLSWDSSYMLETEVDLLQLCRELCLLIPLLTQTYSPSH